jgi:hypothetical protein
MFRRTHTKPTSSHAHTGGGSSTLSGRDARTHASSCLRAGIFGLAVVLVACNTDGQGDSTASSHIDSDHAWPADGGSTDALDAAPGRIEDAGSGAHVARRPDCPALPPADGAPCTPTPPLALSCEYGGDAGRCATYADCASFEGASNFKWHVTATPGCQNDSACPTRFADVVPRSEVPGTLSGECDYPEGRCGAVSCTRRSSDASVSQEMGARWACQPWGHSDPVCSVPEMRIGDACSKLGASCSYGVCGISTRISRRCVDGYWLAGAGAGVLCAVETCDF